MIHKRRIKNVLRIPAQLFWLTIAFGFSAFHPYPKKTLTIDFDLQENKGAIYLAVFNEKKHFLGDEMYAQTVVKIKEGLKPQAVFELEPGNYAISVFQDLNQNGKLDKNWIGIPTEPYGFSNNARGSMGPPKYDDCLVDLNSSKAISIRLD